MLKNYIKSRKNKPINARREAFLVFGIIMLTLILGVNLVSGDEWDLSTAVFDYTYADNDGGLFGLSAKYDGGKIFGLNNGGDVRDINLSSAWDISTGSFIQEENVGGNSLGLYFKPDGMMAFRINNLANVIAYNLSVAWDVSTMLPSGSFIASGHSAILGGVFLSSDGYKMYVGGRTPSRISEWNLSTAWDVTTAVHSENFDIAEEQFTEDCFISPDGTKLFVFGTNNDTIQGYNLSSAWNIATAVYEQYLYVGDKESAGYSLYFNPDGTRIYVSWATQSIHQWNMPATPDTTSPDVTINYPANDTYYVTTIEFNVTATDDTALSSCWYSLTGTNYTLSNS